jgi:high-affinity nickel-transport protein
VSWPVLAVAGSGFLLGCRHGLDWDHISAITDLVAQRAGPSSTGGGYASPAQPKDMPLARHAVAYPLHAGTRRRRSLRSRISLPGSGLSLAVWYCLGHGLVIAVLGAAVGVLGLHLPDGIDRVFESVVGFTLVALGCIVLWQLGRDRQDYRFTGRWRLLIGTIRRARARARHRGTVPEALDDLGPRAAFMVGILHGTGAETPTQVVLFASAGAAGNGAAAAVILLAFVAGLVLSDLGIAAAWLGGLLGVRRLPSVQITLGLLTGASSIAVGALFVMGRSALLPALFGG